MKKQKERIKKIVEAIKKSKDCKCYERMVFSVRSEFGMTRRTAIEYLDLALFELGILKTNLTEKFLIVDERHGNGSPKTFKAGANLEW